MKHCTECGAELEIREHPHEGLIPYCPQCGEYRYPMLNTAVSMLVMNRTEDRMILIRQYGKPTFVLVAGYVNRGEDAEDAAVRELREELGLEAETVRFNRSHYYPRTNTLMLNFTVTVNEEEAHPNWEIDGWNWFSLEEAREQIRQGSLAQAFLNGYLDGYYEFPDLSPEKDTR